MYLGFLTKMPTVPSLPSRAAAAALLLLVSTSATCSARAGGPAEEVLMSWLLDQGAQVRTTPMQASQPATRPATAKT